MKAAAAAAASRTFCADVNPEDFRGAKSWSPSGSHLTRTASDNR